jgi:excisionase family DNA binding protein
MEAERTQVVGQDDEWLTVREAARYLKVSEATVFRWMKSGRLSYCKFGGSTRFRRSFLDRMAERVNGANEGADLPARCSACGHTELVPGKLVSAGSVSFQLEDARFWTLSPSAVPLRVLACTACGHVELFADAIRIDNLKRRSPG